MMDAIISLRLFKAPGSAGIPNVLLKNLPSGSMDSLCDLFNACISRNHLTRYFKVAKVIPIAKPGKDLSQSSNYRPISLQNYS